MKKKAIVVYVDNSTKMEIEFSWLYKTWMLYSLEDEFDLVVYYHPDAKKIIDKFSGIVSYEMPYIRMAQNYKFLNSHYFCLDEFSEPLKKYDYILKTDCDVFLTENIKGYTPSKFMVGQGGYYEQKDNNKINYIKKIAKDLNLEHNNMSGIGTSFFGKTNTVLSIVKNQAILTEKILNEYSKAEEFKNVGFDFGISSMIAGEIIINKSFSNQHVNLYGLDTKCWETTKIGSDVLHIHAWHTPQRWSKHNYFNNDYKDWNVNESDAFKNCANYCQWIAKMSMDKLNEFKTKYKNGELNIDYDLFTKSNCDIPKVSVVIPIYNIEDIDWFKTCIDSIENQTFKDFEVIIVNDGSTQDDVLSYLVQLEKKPNYKIINLKNNLGVGLALNIGVVLSKSEYIIRMDADDIMVQDRIEKQYNFMEKNKTVDVMGGSVVFLKKDKNNQWVKTNKITHPQKITKDIAKNSFWYLNHPTVIFKKSSFLSVGGYKDLKNLPEDYDLWTRMISVDMNIINLDDIYTYYRISPNQQSKTDDNKLKFLKKTQEIL